MEENKGSLLITLEGEVSVELIEKVHKYLLLWGLLTKETCFCCFTNWRESKGFLEGIIFPVILDSQYCSFLCT